MKSSYILYTTILLIIIATNCSSCKKYLAAKSSKELVIPSTVEDLQSLLDNHLVINQKDPAAAEMSSDNYYLTTNDWENLSESERRIYIWEKDHVFPIWPNQWSYAFQPLFIVNTVLNNVKNVTSSNIDNLKNVEGQALFHRAKEFSHIAYIWSLAYDPATANTDLGIPLRLTSDFNEPSVRASVQETYDRILLDLKKAASLLPVTQIHVMRPSKAAAYGLLARVFLSMRLYDMAGKYADSALQLNDILLDYNTVDPSPARPFPKFNPEVVFYTFAGNFPILSNSRAKIDSNLYQSFEENDLRKLIFFRNNNNGTYGFKGTYSGGTGGFTGIANDEIYLIKAECLARDNKVEEAMNTLNALLIKRWKTGTFIPLSAANASEAINIILLERRKELIYRGLRWMDIKRLNKEGAGITLKRVLDGNVYILPPNDLRYALALPEDLLEISGIQQNPR